MGGGGLFEEDFYLKKLICGLSNKFFLKKWHQERSNICTLGWAMVS